MTQESQTVGSIPPLPAWAYWLFVALGAAIPSLLVSGVLPSPFDAVAAAIGAVCAVMTGTNRPAPPAERAQIAALAKAKRNGTFPTCVLCIGLALGAGGCLSLAPLDSDLAVGGTDGPGMTDECRELDRAYMALQITGTILSGIGGAGGAALAIWPDPTRDETIGIGVATAASGILGSGFLLGAGMVAQRFADRCAGQ